MKKITKITSLPLLLLLILTSLFLSSCSSNKPYFSFTPAPPAYVKKQPPVAVKTIATETNNTETDAATLIASAAPATVLPEVAALESNKAGVTNIRTAKTYKAGLAAPTVEKSQKLTLAQKVVMHKVQKQVKKLSTQAKAAAGPVSNRNAIALVLIGIILAVFATLISGGLGNLFYTLGILILLVGLILLILNYV